MLELRDHGPWSQSTAGGLETAGEEEHTDLESSEHHRCGIDGQASGGELYQEHRQWDHEYTRLDCEETTGAREWKTSGGDGACLIAKNTDDLSSETDVTDKPRESVVLNTHDNVDEFVTMERQALSVSDEKVCDNNVTGKVCSDEGVASGGNSDSVDKDTEVAEISMKASAHSPVKYNAPTVVVEGDSCKNTGDVDGSDVTESMSSANSSMDKDTDAAEPSEKATPTLDVHIVASAAAAEADTNCEDDDAGDMERTPEFGSNTLRHVDVTRLSDKTVYSAKQLDVCTVVATEAVASDDANVTESISDVDNGTVNDVDALCPSEKAVTSLPVKCGRHVCSVSVPDDDPSDDDDDDNDADSDVTADMSDNSSDSEEHILPPQQQDASGSKGNLSALSPRSISRLFTVSDLPPEQLSAGRYYLVFLALILVSAVKLIYNRVIRN